MIQSIDSALQARIKSNLQTLANKSNPSMQTIVSRPRTPIFDKKFWQETIVQGMETAVCTSVAVRKQKRYADKVFVSYVTNTGYLVVKSATIRNPIKKMIWTVEMTIPNCVACSIEFNGEFRRGGLNIEYYTEEIPWLFYSTTSGELKAGKIGGPYETLSSDNVMTLDVVRGIASQDKSIDQGMVVFYIFGGLVYYRQYISGVWDSQYQIEMAPVNAEQIKAERLFDYRICLHVTDANGALWEVFTKMAASGWNGHEYLTTGITGTLKVTEIIYIDKTASEYLTAMTGAEVKTLYALSPVMTKAENVADEDGDFGYLVRVMFDEIVMNTAGNEYNFTITDAFNTIYHATGVAENRRELLLTFPNFNNAISPVTIAYTPGTATGEIANMDATSTQATLTGLVPYDVPAPVVQTVENIIDWIEVTP